MSVFEDYACVVQTCEYCKVRDGSVRLIPCRTQYHWENGEEDPNKDHYLCPECAAAYNAYWDEMWAEYGAAQML